MRQYKAICTKPLFKWQNISTKHASLLINISSKKILQIETSFLLKTVFFLFDLNKTQQNLLFWQPSYFCMEKMFMLLIHFYTVFWIVWSSKVYLQFH